MRSLILILAMLWASRVHADPGEPDPVVLEEARREYDRGDAALDLGKYDEAIVAFEKSFELAKRPSALFMLATTYRKRFETRGALADARQARQIYDHFIRADARHASVAYARQQIASLERQIKDAEAMPRTGDGRPAEAAGSPQYRAALGLVAEGKYRDAITKAEEARTLATGPAQLARIWMVIGRAHALAGSADAAPAFQRALSIDPELAAPPDMDAPDGQAFARAQQANRGKAPLTLAADLPPAVRGGASLSIKPSIDSDPMKIIAKVGVRYRVDAASFSEVVGAPGTKLDIPAAVLPPRTANYKVAFYVVGYDAVGAIAASWGSAQDPRRLDVLTARNWETKYGEKRPVYKKWWFWSAAGATVIAAALIFVTTNQPEALRGEGPHVDAPLSKPLLRF